ncbi:unnamed protein product [Brachionus calyciflorus]|uniref:Thioredoxin domain-containing protein n=1 Tax=Brachionus calyciflorus TaxID=104777 RepID=A0A814I2B8_9BILA|nr:unnamed protein product [Brachionus calyciflorus]
MSVIHVKNIDEFFSVTSTGGCIVHYHAYWCTQSRFLERTINKLCKLNPDIKFVLVDVNKSARLMQDLLLNIPSVPYFEVYFDGLKIFNFNVALLHNLSEAIHTLNSKILDVKISDLEEEEVVLVGPIEESLIIEDVKIDKPDESLLIINEANRKESVKKEVKFDKDIKSKEKNNKKKNLKKPSSGISLLCCSPKRKSKSK